MAAFPHKIVFFLICSPLAHTDISGIFKSYDKSRFPKPDCKMYHPMEYSYDNDCPDVIQYICATNGDTYENECFFCVDQWEFGSSIKFEKYGKCG
ncbi:serine protease inhibitor Kazal-type 13 [Otolemur garnettii]|uniref:serine protease inhibitor Kazal-type 13 n=1 Tax=Otolemur garnettii TaxID=30611 RepID=UPI000273F820|nr:serine protease inhibitor Kazal-type 13 [Otolemur garnettii]